MARHATERSQRSNLDEQVQAKGLRAGDYALFFVSREGIFWPPGTEKFEETSGYVLDKNGHVYTFWLGWDKPQGIPALTEWEEVQPEPGWAGVGEYLRARRKLGLRAR